MFTWEAALVIAVIVAAVHMVHRYAYKQGSAAGRAIGRTEILIENFVRAGAIDDGHKHMMILVNQIVDAEETRMAKYNNVREIDYATSNVNTDGQG